jgi:hypothetical protein
MDMIGLTALSSLALVVMGVSQQAATAVIFGDHVPVGLSAYEHSHAVMAGLHRAASGVPY